MWLWISGVAFAATPAAQVLLVEGDVTVDHDGSVRPLEAHDVLEPTDTVMTGDPGAVLLVFPNQVVARIDAELELQVSDFAHSTLPTTSIPLERQVDQLTKPEERTGWNERLAGAYARMSAGRSVSTEASLKETAEVTPVPTKPSAPLTVGSALLGKALSKKDKKSKGDQQPTISPDVWVAAQIETQPELMACVAAYRQEEPGESPVVTFRVSGNKIRQVSFAEPDCLKGLVGTSYPGDKGTHTLTLP